ncbi:MAG: acetoacetate decarboxylase [Actinobacteria bacterium]|jgi:acetoacetate decarboxylase|nr:acetoacetate decarboxylase [Actinomycetota bacterium]NDF10639.1 acetoacetate decarboxylase [Actinomycetota bacterium]
MSELHYLHEIPSPYEAHSFPLDNPLTGPATPAKPARFNDCEVLVAQYRTNPDAIAALVPEPLVPVGDVVMVQFGRWGDVPGMGANTQEVNVMVQVEFNGPNGKFTGAYSPYFFVDSDRAMAGGREFHGQPKRFGNVKIDIREDLIVGSLARNEINVFTATFPYKSKRAEISDVSSRVNFTRGFNLKLISQIDSTRGIRQLTMRDFHDVKVSECWTGPVTSRIEENVQAPIYRLPVLQHLEGYYWKGSFTLQGGIILHEYEGVPGK